MQKTESSALPALVTAQWLASEISSADLRVLDASWYLPAENRNAFAEFEKEHIPGAVFFDIDAVSDLNSDLPHMLPAEEAFSTAMSKLGLSDSTRIIVYDGHGLMSAARAWWMFRVFGHDNVAVLNGGFAAWKNAGQDVTSCQKEKDKSVSDGNFTAHLNSSMIRSQDQLRENLNTKLEQIIDARPAGRFKGVDPEPRAGLPSGHIPGSINVPFLKLLNPETRQLLEHEKLEKCFTEAGVDLQRPITTSCGSGVTACVLALGLYVLGRKDVAIYDGSWADWGGSEHCPIETS